MDCAMLELCIMPNMQNAINQDPTRSILSIHNYFLLFPGNFANNPVSITLVDGKHQQQSA